MANFRTIQVDDEVEKVTRGGGGAVQRDEEEEQQAMQEENRDQVEELIRSRLMSARPSRKSFVDNLSVRSGLQDGKKSSLSRADYDEIREIVSNAGGSRLGVVEETTSSRATE